MSTLGLARARRGCGCFQCAIHAAGKTPAGESPWESVINAASVKTAVETAIVPTRETSESRTA